MLVITASDGKYKEILERTKDQYDLIYDLGGLGFGKPWDLKPRDSREIRRWKPRYLLRTLREFNKPVAWVDADSLIVKPLDPKPDYDIALVVRKKKSQIKFKSATVFVQPTEGSVQFLKRWIQVIPENGKGDQIYLRHIISQYYPLTRETYSKNKVLDINGTRVKLLDRSTYCWEFKRIEDINEVPNWARVVHFSGWSGPNKHRQKMEIFRQYMSQYG